MIFAYPVTNKFEARVVTEPDYEPNLFDGDHDLYVDMDVIRGNDFMDNLRYDLGIENDKVNFIGDSAKIIFSGHRGCGKTTELQRLNVYLNNPDRFFTVFISLEEETEISRFEPEDFFLLLILKLIAALDRSGISINTKSLGLLAERLFSNEEILNEINKIYKGEIGQNSSVGINLLGWLKSKANFKTIFAAQNQTKHIIRKEIRQNNLEIINDFNLLLVDIREAVKAAGLGQDIIYIVDGSEKIKFEVYDKLFIQDGNLLKSVNCNMVISIRIDAFYRIEKSPIRFTNQYILPMIKLWKKGASDLFRDALTRRIDKDIFLEDDAVDLAIEMSGGCIRQLFYIINSALRIQKGGRINSDAVEKAVNEIGARLRETLDSKHIETLLSERFEPGDEKTRELLHDLVLLKYNGVDSIKINPLLKVYFP